MVSLKTRVETLGGVYKRYSRLLEKLGIITVEDFLLHIPFRYDNYTVISEIAKLQPGDIVTVKGVIKDMGNTYLRSYRTIQRAILEDETGIVEVVWFNQPYLTKNIPSGSQISIAGKVSEGKRGLVFQSPDYELLGKDFIHTGRLVPVYPETRGVSSRWLRKENWKLLNNTDIVDFLPEKVKEENNLSELKDAFSKAHFPINLKDVELAKKRLSFDELFISQLSSLKRKKDWGGKIKGKRDKNRRN